MEPMCPPFPEPQTQCTGSDEVSRLGRKSTTRSCIQFEREKGDDDLGSDLLGRPGKTDSDIGGTQRMQYKAGYVIHHGSDIRHKKVTHVCFHDFDVHWRNVRWKEAKQSSDAARAALAHAKLVAKLIPAKVRKTSSSTTSPIAP
jgi:hypothetical protein